MNASVGHVRDVGADAGAQFGYLPAGMRAAWTMSCWHPGATLQGGALCEPRSRPERVVHNTTMFTELSDAHGGAPPPLPPRATPDTSRAPTPSPDTSNQAVAQARSTAHSPIRQGLGGTADPGASAPTAPPEGPDPPHYEPAATTTGRAHANVPHAPRRLRQDTMDAYTHMFVVQPTETQAPYEPHPMHNNIAQGDDP